MEVDKEVYDKLVRTTNLYLKIHSQEDLNPKQIRRLQYLVKVHLKEDKPKLFSLINVYKNTKNIYLKQFCYDLLEDLEKKT